MNTTAMPPDALPGRLRKALGTIDEAARRLEARLTEYDPALVGRKSNVSRLDRACIWAAIKDEAAVATARLQLRDALQFVGISASALAEMIANRQLSEHDRRSLLMARSTAVLSLGMPAAMLAALRLVIRGEQASVDSLRYWLPGALLPSDARRFLIAERARKGRDGGAAGDVEATREDGAAIPPPSGPAVPGSSPQVPQGGAGR